MANELVPHSTIEEIVGHRNQALDLYRVAYDAIKAADEAIEAAHAEAALAAPSRNSRYTHAHAPES